MEKRERLVEAEGQLVCKASMYKAEEGETLVEMESEWVSKR